ncbi:phosphotransferase [uncultured Maribacter sp.]|uniref:phosphotransferase n=1 Tax=uncultured Maribacter sp. TaxID=431308 RepID=UPI0030D97D2F|tara:strand:+ start:885 stop:1868 length:984 start_codon:yes stop_codon:yes gene_type:complete
MKAFPVIASILSAKELGEFVKEKYGLHENYQCSLIRTGMNHTYFLSNHEAKFVLRVYSHNWRSKNEINEELGLLKFLKENALSVSVPIHDCEENYIQEITAPEGIRYVVLFSFSKGDKIRFMNHETLFNIGSNMGKMHQLTFNKKIERLNYAKQSLIELPYQQLTHFFSESLPEMKYLKELGESFNDEDFFDKNNGVVHMDIWYDNMSVLNDNEITLFDFDFCGNGSQILDIAYFCKQLFFIETDKEQYQLKVKSFLNGYQKTRVLTNQEINVLPIAGAATFMFYLGVQAKRFDWSNVFLTENYLKMFVGRIKLWMEYHKNKEKLYQ